MHQDFYPQRELSSIDEVVKDEHAGPKKEISLVKHKLDTHRQHDRWKSSARKGPPWQWATSCARILELCYIGLHQPYIVDLACA